MQSLKIQTFDQCFVRRDGRLVEVSATRLEDDRMVVSRQRLADSAKHAEVEEYVQREFGLSLLPLFDRLEG